MLQILFLVVVIGFGVLAASYLLLWWAESRRPRVLCLMYHRLAPRAVHAQASGTERIFTLPVEEFRAQLHWLRQAGYTFLSPDQMCAHATGQTTAPDRSVLLTFDDGCVSVYEHGLPALREHGARATVFVTTDPDSHVFRLGAGGDRRMTDDELRATDGDVLTCASHSVTHRPLSGLSADEIREELTVSRRVLEATLGREVAYLAIPGNWFDARVMKIAGDAGYKAVWCSNPGMTRQGSPLMGLPRVNVEGTLAIEQFAGLISPSGVALRRLISLLKRTPGRVLGPRLWLPVRKSIMRCIPGGYISTRRIAGAALAMALVAVLLWIML